MKRPHLPRTPLDFAVWAAMGLLAIPGAIFLLNVETFAQSRGMDRIWATPMFEPSGAGWGILAALAGVGGGFLLRHWFEPLIARFRVHGTQTDIAEITFRFVPGGNPVEVENINVHSWSAATMAMTHRDATGKEIGMPVQFWFVALWFDKPLNGYQVAARSIVGPIPHYDVRFRDQRGIHLMVRQDADLSVIQFSCTKR